MKKLVYIMDPQCGWCYGNSTNMTDIYQRFKNDFEFEVVVGGLWVSPEIPKGGAMMSRFIEGNSPRMEHTTGAKVGQAYYDLTKDETYTFSSLEPSAAIVAVKTIALDKSLSFAKAVQNILFSDGLRLDELPSYKSTLEHLSIDVQQFEKEWLSENNIAKTEAEFKRAKALTKSFPSLIVQEKIVAKNLTTGYFDKEALIEQLNQLK